MRKIELKLEPPKLQITQQEILADLHYPAPAGARAKVRPTSSGKRA